MHYLTLLPVLLAPFAAALPAAEDSVTIYDSPNFRGQHRIIPVNGICVNLGPPLSVHKWIDSDHQANIDTALLPAEVFSLFSSLLLKAKIASFTLKSPMACTWTDK